MARPRSFLSPVLIGIGAYVHRKFGAKELVTLLPNLGFSASYDEVLRLESSILNCNPSEITNDGFQQFVFDNADHNVNTLDGLG